MLAICASARPSSAGTAPRTDASLHTEEAAARLERGETIVYDQTLESKGRRYVGGVTYTLVDAPLPELLALFEDVSAYKQVLPRTKQARLVGVNDGDLFVELRQGNSLLEAAYTIRVHQHPLPSGGGTEFRFWLDQSKPHGIEDAWGYFRLQPVADGPTGAPRVLLTYGILVDIGPGLVRDLFEERARQMALTVPQRVRQYALAHLKAPGRAS